MHTDPTHEGLCVREIPNLPTSVRSFVIRDELQIACGDESCKFLTCQLSMVMYWLAMAVASDR